MDTTPSKLMFEAMCKFRDAMCGEEPNAMDVSTAANNRRIHRRFVMDFLHQFGATCMREGVNRKIAEVQGARHTGGTQIVDREDAGAAAKARDDAEAGRNLVVIK